MKKCCRCKIEKILDEFYRDRSSKDGLENRCKKCSLELKKVKDPKKCGRKKLLNKICPRCKFDKSREHFYEGGKNGPSWICKSCYGDFHKKEGHESILEAAKRYRESSKGKEYRKTYLNGVGSKYRAKYKLEGKTKARSLARYHLERKPCEICGDINVNAHHEDYSKPLEVRWLCTKHHGEEHRKHG